MRGVKGIFFSYSTKALQILILAICCLTFKKIDFPTIDFLIRDGLQFFNTRQHIDNSIVTVNIDITGRASYPFKYEDIRKTITAIQQSQPKNIVLFLEPNEISSSPTERQLLLEYFNTLDNLYLYAADDAIFNIGFESDPLFKTYKNLFYLAMTGDRLSATKNDAKFRRAILNYDNGGESVNFKSIKKLGLTSKDLSYYKYPYKFWGTTQAYIKNFPLGTFGYIQLSTLEHPNTSTISLKGKTVLLGSFNEFSFLQRPSIFNVLPGKYSSSWDSHFFPFQETVANLINFHTTGDYIKYLQDFNGLYIVFFFLTFLILSTIEPKKKLYLFFLLTPSILLFTLLLYVSCSFYIDFSKSIALLIVLQYLAVPILMFSMFKSQESQKMQEITDARIDALLKISERLAHDIRSPLSAIRLMLSKAKFDSAEQKEITTSALNRINEIAEDLLKKYTKPSNVVTDEVVNLADSLNMLIEEKKAFNPRIIFRIENISGSKPLVNASKLEIDRIISNIIDNAIYALKDTPEPSIAFYLSEKHTSVNLKIEDNGPGIPSSILAILGSQRFSTKGDAGGSGIGLLHARQSIKNMGGSFEIKSSSRGTAVLLEFKLASNPQ